MILSESLIFDALRKDIQDGVLEVSYLETSQGIHCWLRMWNGFVVKGFSNLCGVSGTSLSLLDACAAGVRFEEFKGSVKAWGEGLVPEIYRKKGVVLPSLFKGTEFEFLPALEIRGRENTDLVFSALCLLKEPEFLEVMGGVHTCLLSLGCGWNVVGSSYGGMPVLDDFVAMEGAGNNAWARVFELENYLVQENRWKLRGGESSLRS